MYIHERTWAKRRFASRANRRPGTRSVSVDFYYAFIVRFPRGSFPTISSKHIVARRDLSDTVPLINFKRFHAIFRHSFLDLDHYLTEVS